MKFRLPRSDEKAAVTVSYAPIYSAVTDSLNRVLGGRWSYSKFEGSFSGMVPNLKIVVVEEDPDLAQEMVDALLFSCECQPLVIDTVASLASRITDFDPDVVLIDIDNPTRDTLEELALATGPLERPVAMFVSSDTPGFAETAIEAGVSAYVVDGLAMNRLKPVIDTAIARFRMTKRIRSELAETRRALEERKLIDRAKGILMKAKGIDEDAAYALLRKTAMDQGSRLAEVAEALVTASRLLQ